MKLPWTTRRDDRRPQAASTAKQDTDAARLTARADLIVEELDAVVAQMSTMLRKAYRDDAP